MIDRNTILRIVLATGPVSPLWFDADEEQQQQISASPELTTQASNDIVAVSKRYAENRGRMAGAVRQSFQASAVLARVEWIEEILGSLGNGDIAGAAVRHLAKQLRECQVERDGLLAKVSCLNNELSVMAEELAEMQDESRADEDEIDRLSDTGEIPT